MLPLVEVGEAEHLSVVHGHGAAAAFGDGGGQLGDAERPDRLGVAIEEFVAVLGEAGDRLQVTGLRRAVAELHVSAAGIAT